MSPNWLGLAAAAVLVGFVAELLRRGILRERFAALWLVVCAALVVFTVFPGLLQRSADMLGFQLPSNLLFFGAIVFLLLISVQLSYEVSRLEARTRRLAEELALMRTTAVDRSDGRRGPAGWEDSAHAGPEPPEARPLPARAGPGGSRTCW